MAKLQKDKAFKSNELKELADVGKRTLKMAEDVSDDVKKSLAEIMAQYNQIPAQARQEGVERAVKSAQKRIQSGKYNLEKKRLENTIKRMEEAVPQHDKECAGQLKQLSGACDRLYARITDLERFLQKGKMNLSPGQFKKELEEYQKKWEEEGKALEAILEAVKAGLKGLALKSCMYSRDPVNLSTGNFIYDKTDIKIKGEPGLLFRRFYNALETRKGVMGTGWIHNYEICIVKEKNEIHIFLEDGKEEYYEENGEGYFESVGGNLATVTGTEEGYLYERTDGHRYYFDQKGRYVRYEDEKGTALFLSYNEEGKLERVQEETENAAVSFLAYGYNEEGLLAEVTDHTGRHVRLLYEGERLSRVEAPAGTVYGYKYDSSGRLAQVENAAGTVTVKNIYDGEGRTKRQVFPDGSRMKYRYMDADGQVELTERNGAKIIYCHDALYRNTKTIYEDGEELYTYDRNNQRTSYTDKNGNRTVYGYEDRGHLTKVVDALGNRASLTYNGNGKLMKVSLNGVEKIRNHYDRNGNLVKTSGAQGIVEFEYDQKRRPVCIVQADGSRLELGYDAKGNVVKLTDAAGNDTLFTYDELGRVAESRDGNGNVTRYRYNEKDELIAVTNAEGNTKEYEYNHGGKVTKITDFDGSITELAYNCLNRVEQVTDAEGNRTTYAYDRMWNVAAIEEPEGGRTEYVYDLQNRLEMVTDAEGNSVKYVYDACGNRTQVQGKNGEQTSYVYDALNRMVKVTEPDGVVTEFSYDVEGKMTDIKDSIGNFKKMVYNRSGKCISETDQLGREKKYQYDAMGNQTVFIDAAGRKTQYYYKKGGQLEKVVYPDGTWECYVYDGCGNVVRKERTGGYTVEYQYDCLNRLIRMQSSTGQTKCYRYDAVGNVTAVTDANGNETHYHYNRNGVLSGVKDAEGGMAEYHYNRNGFLEEALQLGREGEEEEPRRIRYGRNHLGQVTEAEDAFGRKEYFVYDSDGRLAEKTDRDGNRTEYTYNNIGQPQRIIYGDGKEVQFTYNALRQLQEVKDWLGTMTFTHDEEGRLTDVTDQRGKKVQYRYGSFGEREAVIYPDGTEVTYRYDELLRLSSLKSGSREASYRYDAMGRLAARQTSEGILTEYGYDAVGLLSTLTHTGAAGLIEAYRYDYDPAGNRIREERFRQGLEEENGIYTYGYDNLHRLIQTAKDGNTLRGYRYDSFGNRTEKTERGVHTCYTYNSLNQLIQDTDGLLEHRYEYDNRGNLVKTLENGVLQHAYEFGAMNRMTRAVDGMGNVAEYHYNGLGYRTGMRQGVIGCSISQGLSGHRTKEALDFGADNFIPQTPEVWSKETAYILDFTKNYHNLLQKEECGNIQSYIWDSEVLFMEENGESYSYLNDMQGSAMRLFNHGGEDVISYRYDEFGTDLSGNQGQLQPFGYTGYQRDTVAGTYYAQAREYDAGSGRFTSEDMVKGSVTYPETLNAYGYCWGNPLMFVDRDGREPKFVPGDDYEKIGTDENGVPIIKKKEQYFVPADDYVHVGYDEQTGMEIIKKKEEISDISNVDLIEGSYDITVDGMDVLNKTTDLVEPAAIKSKTRPGNIGKGAWDKKIAKEIAEQSKFHKGLGKVLDKAGEIGVILDGVKSVYDNIKAGTSWPKILIDLGVDMLVSLGLLSLGGLITSLITTLFALGGTITIPGIGTVGAGAVGAVVGTIASIILIGMIGNQLYKKDDDGKSIVDQIKDFIWDLANGELTNGSSCPADE